MDDIEKVFWYEKGNGIVVWELNDFKIDMAKLLSYLCLVCWAAMDSCTGVE